MIFFNTLDPDILTLTFNGYTDLRTQAYGLDELISICKKHDRDEHRLCILMDVRDGATLGASGRMLTINTLREHRPLFERVLAGWAFVLTSPFNRGVVAAVGWIARVPFRTATFATLEEAQKWCAERLQQKT